MAREHGYPCTAHSTYSTFSDKADNWARFVECVKRAQESSEPPMGIALSYIAGQSTEQLSVPKIAKHVGIGRQTLERGFREHLGRTVNEELIRLKISKLKRLLVESEESVKELSGKVGFGTTANMFPMFKRHTGMTPKEYREKHGSSQRG